MVETLLEPVTEFALSRDQPFPGLRPYGEEDAGWFFGRSGEINELLKRLRRLHFVAIVGASGSGKSSLVRAGVLPQIRDGYLDAEWQIAAFRPGEQPLANLAAALNFSASSSSEDPAAMLRIGPMGLVRAIQMSRRPGNSRLLILVDQFEELFQFAQRTGDSAQEEIKEFLKLLLTAASSDEVAVYVVVTMRLEWMSECAGYAGLAEAINEGIYLVPQMQRRQFGQAILGPLEAAGGGLTSALLDRMLNDLDNRSDQLPVLQHALLRLWERTGAREPFGLADYEAVGTFSNCLSAHAEEVYAELTPREQHIAELLFRAITQVNKGRKIRRPRPLSEVMQAAQAEFNELETVIRAFNRPGRSFLVTTQGALTPVSIVDISHEALIRQWTRLSDWVDREAELQTRLRRLEEDAAEWDRDRAGSKACLYTGSRLVRIEELPLGDVSHTATAFVKESARARFWQLARQRGWIVLIVVLLVGVTVFVSLERAKTARALAAAQASRLKQAESDALAASLQAKKAREFQDNLVQQIGAAKGNQSALAAIAQNIQAKRVYLQYLPGGMQVARTLQGQLQQRGFVVPGIEQVSPTLSPAQTQVRFFHNEDRGDAQRLAGLLKTLLPGNAVAQSTGNPKEIVPEGQFEVWVAPPASAQQPAPTAVATNGPPAIETKAVTNPAAQVPPSPVPTIEASLSQERVQQESDVTLSWSTQNASQVHILEATSVARYDRIEQESPSGWGKTGWIILKPKVSTRYRLIAQGDGGTAVTEIAVEVTPISPATSASTTAQNPGPAAIKAALIHYKEAYESESLDEMLKVWPTMSKARQKDLKTAFSMFNAIHMTLTCNDQDIHMRDEEGSARCIQSAVYTKQGKRQPEQSGWAFFLLRKSGGDWVVVAVQ